eukprot:TRINITY_DN462_c0_g1_i1.p1 TRINITY_DN462_c0_g1~~TRINITY_DN462_c0_g1_i1.p1  ORF type:complete len:174 (+),score=12.14 TRINITY_DN462_c0_g1_i1:279-800(+)
MWKSLYTIPGNLQAAPSAERFYRTVAPGLDLWSPLSSSQQPAVAALGTASLTAVGLLSASQIASIRSRTAAVPAVQSALGGVSGSYEMCLAPTDFGGAQFLHTVPLSGKATNASSTQQENKRLQDSASRSCSESEASRRSQPVFSQPGYFQRSQHWAGGPQRPADPVFDCWME